MPSFPKTEIVCAALFLGVFAPGRADVKMPAIFGDHMVLQRQIKLPVWGKADPGEKVRVSIGPRSGETTAGPDGKWRLDLQPLEPGTAPLEMTVQGKNMLQFKDVMVGDVWFCSGQSNMEINFQRLNQMADVAKTDDPRLRYFRVAKKPHLTGADDVAGEWVLCTPEKTRFFSAVGYYFGAELRNSIGCPIGLIDVSWGGSLIRSWVSPEAARLEAKNDPVTADYLRQLEIKIANYGRRVAEYPAKKAAYDAERKVWETEVEVPFKQAQSEWYKKKNEAVAAGHPEPPRPVVSRPCPRPPEDPNGSGFEPSVIFNGEMRPIIPYAIKGVLWYQGESNVTSWAYYEEFMKLLIADWRALWGQGSLPFLFVQLASFDPRKETPQDSERARLREAQLRTLSVPNTGMAVALDLGMASTIHPPNKRDVGLRLARLAERIVYGRQIVASGPLYDSMTIEGRAARLTFKETGGGLGLGMPPWKSPEGSPSSTELKGFAIAGADRTWRWAKARIESGNTVIVESAEISHPVAVRYGWADNPEANLYNKEGFPASPFRTDDWPWVASDRTAKASLELTKQTNLKKRMNN